MNGLHECKTCGRSVSREPAKMDLWWEEDRFAKVEILRCVCGRVEVVLEQIAARDTQEDPWDSACIVVEAGSLVS